MSRTPESYIDKSRKAAHDTFALLSAMSLLLSAIALLLGKGGPFFFWLFASVVLGWVASKIKYVWRKVGEAGQYTL